MKQEKNICLADFSSCITMKNVDKLLFSIVWLLFVIATAYAQDAAPGHLKRSVDTISTVSMEISTKTALYKPIFGAGDANAEMVKGVKRYGYLTLVPGGKSQAVNYGREELVYYVLEGEGMLHYGEQDVAISKDDFFYVPINTEHSFSTPPQSALNVMVMGFKIPEETQVKPTSQLQLASANEVEFQTLEQLNHGPTSRFQLLLGTTSSKRDRLAAAYQVLSLYVIDFDHGGTNIPHRHENEEEIYFVLQGKGEMVAGETPEGEPRRYAVKAGDAFFFSRNSLVGFYSGTREGEAHARILAVRSKYPEHASSEE
jgi:mannose-6-phosphate isomerase-like protein (cupin superfamily)